jgi:hypothetical protein
MMMPGLESRKQAGSAAGNPVNWLSSGHPVFPGAMPFFVAP